MLQTILAQAQSAPPQQMPGGGIGSFFLSLIFIFIIMYFVMIRHQKKRQQQQQNLMASLKTGDRVVTKAGIHGLISSVKENTVLVSRDSFGVMLFVYITVFAWYFIDPFLHPEEYDYLPPNLLGQSYGQVLLFLIGFRIVMPVATRLLRIRTSSLIKISDKPG